MAIETRIRIGDLSDRQIGVADSAINRFVFLPEPALELQSDFDRRGIGYRVDRSLHAGAYVDLDLAENGEREGADASVSFCQMCNSGRFDVDVGDGDAAIILLNPGHLCIVANEIVDLPGECL